MNKHLVKKINPLILQCSQNRINFSSAALNQLIDSLDKRISNIFDTFFSHRIPDSHRQNLLTHYPHLAVLIRQAVVNWYGFIETFFIRLINDVPLLLPSSAKQNSKILLTKFLTGFSDTHRGGHAVIRFKIDGHSELIYKPSDLTVAARFIDLCKHINNHLEFPLHIRKILSRDGYGWDEFVASAKPKSSEMLKQYFYKYGASLFLLQMLHARDFHKENIGNSTDSPVIYDLEGLIHPRLTAHDKQTKTERQRIDYIQHSPLKIGVLQPFSFDEDRFHACPVQ